MAAPETIDQNVNVPDVLTVSMILHLWIPLAFTWLMMATEGPYLAAIIARLPSPKLNLAAFGVSFSLALFVEAPIIMMMSAATALVRDRESYRRLRNFTFFLNAGISLFMLFLLWPVVFRYLTIDLMDLPLSVSSLAHQSLIFFFPWPAAIGFRRFYQGILIKGDRTKRVTLGTAIRLTTITVVATLLYQQGTMSGATIGSAALGLAVVIEAIAIRCMSASLIQKLLQTPVSQNGSLPPLTYRRIIAFYYPLALTALIFLGVNPLVTFFLGQSRYPLESLAVYPVVNSLTFLFRSIGISFQEVSIALIGERFQHYKILRNFTLVGSAILTIGLGAIAFTPLAYLWFRDVSALSAELTAFTVIPLHVLVLMPGLTMILSLQRAILVADGTTGPVTTATLIEIGFVTILLMVTTIHFTMVGITAAALSILLGRLAANIYLIFPDRRILRANHIR